MQSTDDLHVTDRLEFQREIALLRACRDVSFPFVFYPSQLDFHCCMPAGPLNAILLCSSGCAFELTCNALPRPLSACPQTNIVQFQGVVLQPDGSTMLVTEYMASIFPILCQPLLAYCD